METIRVEEILRPHGTCALSVSVTEITELEEVINKFTENPAIHGIFLVDSNNRFRGIIRLRDLRKWVQLRILKEQGMHRTLSAWEAYHIVSADKSVDLVYGDRDSLGLQVNDTLQKALQKMVEYETNILPVLDNDDRIIGELLITHVLHKVVETGKQANTK